MLSNVGHWGLTAGNFEFSVADFKKRFPISKTWPDDNFPTLKKQQSTMPGFEK